MKKRKKELQILSVVAAMGLTCMPVQTVFATGTSGLAGTILINEVESDDADGGNDWVEIINTGETAADISGWYLTDDKGQERVTEASTYQLPAGTVLSAGGVLVLEDTINFDFGLGKADSAILFNAAGEQMDSFSWTAHAEGTYSRNDSGEFVDQPATKGEPNTATPPVSANSFVINEINSSPDDWVEFMNIGESAVELTGWEIRDNSNDHRFRFADGTTVEAGQLLLVKADTAGLVFDDSTDTFTAGIFDEAIGIGSGDSIRLYNAAGAVVDSYSWTEHANKDGDESASWGRYPDGKGNFTLMPETPGEANSWYVPSVVINEVESNGDATDWVEVYNTGSQAVNISGWYLLDNDPIGHAADTIPVADGTILAPGELYVFDTNTHFTFGLGKADSANIYSASGALVASYSWEAHAEGVYARIPDGTGELVDFPTSTKGEPNIIVNPVVINEIQSNDPNGGSDWIELANPTDEDLDISGIVIKDNDDSHGYVIPAGTVIPANDFKVIYEDDFGFGLGKGDSVRLYEDGMLIKSATWEGHTSPTWGLYPNVKGSEFRSTLYETPGAANKFAGVPEVIDWPGAAAVVVSPLNFLEDSSGLDFYNGQLYAVDNGTGRFWILDVAKDGTLSFADGYEEGMLVNFTTPSAKGPDTEGITVDSDGYVYLASERDNSNKGVNYNVILKADPNAAGNSQNAMQQWDLTATLPAVAANMGIEAVEWVANENVKDVLIDKNTNAGFDPANYPDATADGVFFVALEDNGHVYAYVLNSDSSVVQIADIDGKLGGAMALDYDTYEHKLWVAADDGYGNMSAVITLNGTVEPDIVHVSPAADLDATRNNEGFAIASPEYTVNGQRPVYHFADGYATGSLTIGSLDCDYVQHEHSFGTDWIYDTQNHWHQCSCGEKSEIAQHTLSDVVMEGAKKSDATCTSGAVYYKSCSVCGYISTSEVFTSGEPIDHIYENGVCIMCGAKEEASSTDDNSSDSDSDSDVDSSSDSENDSSSQSESSAPQSESTAPQNASQPVNNTQKPAESNPQTGSTGRLPLCAAIAVAGGILVSVSRNGKRREKK